MSNLNELKLNSVRLFPNKLMNRSPNFVQKYYFKAGLLIVEYR